MGRIKTKLIKAMTFTLIEKYGDRFTTDYGKNKQVVSELISCDSKKIRNTIAGYITRLKRVEK
jgi:small subunit ribosomal protein S17e